MKMLMILTSSECKVEVEAFLKEQKVAGYTEIPSVYGEGHTGPKFGSWAFPGTSTIIFTVIPKEKAEIILKSLTEHCTRCRHNAHILSWDVEMLEVKNTGI